MQNNPNPYAPPPGGPPPQYGFPPGYGGPPGQMPPPKKSNTWVFLLVGCVGLLFIGGIVLAIAGAGVATYLERSRSAGSHTGGHAACAQAAACCRKISSKSGSPNSACDGLNNPGVPTTTCEQALEGYKQAATLLGVTCP